MIEMTPTTDVEGPVAKAIEQQTTKLPSDLFLWAAAGTMAASLVLQRTNRRESGLFLGQLVPSLLILGLYNKLVKVAGSDRPDQENREMVTS